MQLQEFTTLLSLAVAPTSAAGLTLTLFEFTERIASPNAKAALTKRLSSFNPTSTPDLHDGARDIMNRAFGRRHFTLQCFLRSAGFSIGSIIAIGFLYLLIHGRDERLEQAFLNPTVPQLGGLFLWSWALFSIFPDYLNLYKTRAVLNWLKALRQAPSVYLLILLVADFIIGLILYSLSSGWIAIIGMMTNEDPIYEGIGWKDFLAVFPTLTPDRLFGTAIFDSHDSILFYAGMVPSIWLWIAVGAIILTRILFRSGSVVAFSLWFLNIEQAPFRSVGVVASVCVFGATLIGMGINELIKLI